MKPLILIALFVLFSSNVIANDNYYSEYSSYIETLSDKEKPSTFYVIGYKYFFGDKETSTKKDTDKAVYWFLKSARAGEPAAQDIMGVIYALGIGVDVDYKKAFFWDVKAAKNKISKSQYRVAESYSLGRGTIENYKKSYSWYAIAELSAQDEDLKLKSRESKHFMQEALSVEALEQAQDFAEKMYSEIYN